MSGLQKERAQFLARMAREGMPEATARLILRHATTVQRCAVLACNDEHYCNRIQARCPECQGADHVQKPARLCPACRAEHRIATLLQPYIARGFVPVFGGDPRGACVKVRVPSGYSDDWGRDGVCVPTKRF